MNAAGNDRIRFEIRAVAALIVVVLLFAVAVLYLLPTETARLWAWTITPTMTPMLMGAGYAAGAYFFARVLWCSEWHRVAIGFLAITLFTWIMLLSTVIHWDRFNHGHFAFWAWFGLYLVTPFLVPALWLRNRMADPRTPGPYEVVIPKPARISLTAVGLAILLLALVMVFVPGAVLSTWPWQLTPLTARVVAGFLGLTGASLVGIAIDARWTAARIMSESLILGVVLIMAAVPRAWDNFDPTSPARWIYVAGLGCALVGLLSLYVAMELRVRAHLRTMTASQR
jgi:hypothetical protein